MHFRGNKDLGARPIVTKIPILSKSNVYKYCAFMCIFPYFQEPGGTMILKASYGGHAKDGASTDFNPYFGTDVGICSIIKPQLSFNNSLGTDHK